MKVFSKRFYRTGKRAVRGLYRHVSLGSRKLSQTRLRFRVGMGTVYDLFLQSHRKKPDKHLFRLLQSFQNYVMELDPVFDSPSFGPRQNKRFGIRDLKAIPMEGKLAREFVLQLEKTPLPMETKKELLRTFFHFRKQAVKNIETTMLDPFGNERTVFEGIAGTAGLFLATASDLACQYHGITGLEKKQSHDAFLNFTSGLQILDDFRDATRDFGVVQNALVSISTRFPIEHDRLRQKSRQHNRVLSVSWIRKNMPFSYGTAVDAFEAFVKRIPAQPAFAPVRSACQDAFFALGT